MQKKRFPFTSYPTGIFAVCFSHELAKKQVMPIVFMGERVALFRTEHGEIGAIERYCPHLGADLTCGVIQHETLECAFHGLRFSKEGVAGKYSVKKWRTFEKYGLIFLIHPKNINLTFPEWDLLEWGKPIIHCFKIRSHPQEILENSVDLLHFFNVHHYMSAQTLSPLEIIGPEFKIKYHLTRNEGIFGRLDKKKIELMLDIHAYGLGMSQVDITIPQYGLTAKQIVFPTPIEDEFIHLRTLTSIKLPKLPFLPIWLRKKIANCLSFFAAKGFLKDFLPDLKIWENKKYIANPNYLPKDGEFEKYRKWAAQFYGEHG